MKWVDIVIVGGGQAGLAIGNCLARRGIDYVILERGEIAERWRSERWDSLRLLTPNWMTRLPGWSYTGEQPDQFMPARDLAGFLGGYARSFTAAPRRRPPWWSGGARTRSRPRARMAA